MKIAQINIAKMKGEKESPVMIDFVNNLERINSLADKSDGFVWRLIEEESYAANINFFADEYLLVNMSVWEDLDCLHNFTYQSLHREIFKRKQEWFNKMEKMHMAIWFLEGESYPTVNEGRTRLEYIQNNGPTPYAFSFKNSFKETDLAEYNLAKRH